MTVADVLVAEAVVLDAICEIVVTVALVTVTAASEEPIIWQCGILPSGSNLRTSASIF